MEYAVSNSVQNVTAVMFFISVDPLKCIAINFGYF